MGNEQTIKITKNDKFKISKEKQRSNAEEYIQALHAKIKASKKRTFGESLGFENHQAQRRQEAIEHFNYLHEASKEEAIYQIHKSHLNENLEKRSARNLVRNIISQACQTAIRSQLNLSAENVFLRVNTDNLNEHIEQENSTFDKENIFTQFDHLVENLYIEDQEENLISEEEGHLNLSQETVKDADPSPSQRSFSYKNSENCETDFKTEQTRCKLPHYKSQHHKPLSIKIDIRKFLRSNSPNPIKTDFNSKPHIQQVRSMKINKMIQYNSLHLNLTPTFN
jgi:hypothetical protein